MKETDSRATHRRISSTIRCDRVGSVGTGRKRTVIDHRDERSRELPPKHFYVIHQVFKQYVTPSSASRPGGIGVTRFRRFLRDAGLLEGPGGSKPCDEKASKDHFRQLNPALADLILSKVSSNPANYAGEPGGLSATDGLDSKNRLVTVEAFALALAKIAKRCYPDIASESRHTALRFFCARILDPIHGRHLLREEAWTTQPAIALLYQPPIAALLSRSAKQLAEIFASRAIGRNRPEPYRQGHWTIAALFSLATEADFLKYFSRAYLAELFEECVFDEVSEGRGQPDKMSFGAFKVCLIAIAQYAAWPRMGAVTQTEGATSRVRQLLMQMNALSPVDLALCRRLSQGERKALAETYRKI